LDNFPKPPGSASSSFFFRKVENCENHSLFPDLINHLSQSGFNVCSRWTRYKEGVKELDTIKRELLSAIEKTISDIFPSLQLKFVDVPDLERFFEDFNPIRLEDFECCLPSLMYNYLLFELDIDDERLKIARTREEYEEIYNDITGRRNYSGSIEEDIKKSYLSEMGNSVSWGRGWIMELIRVPKSYSSSLGQGIEKAAAFFSEGSETTIDLVQNIFDKYKLLEREKKLILDELNRSLYCQCFSGDCRYLGE
jgi:hypothetical protein